MTMDALRALEAWLANHSNGEWEHQYGVRIENLDNPGWSIHIDLIQTELSGVVFEEVTIDRTDEDWVRCRVRADVFEGFGGASNLREILGIFQTWQEKFAGGSALREP
ncbi:immunity 53 family protein [Myxococcus sp. CA056]|uniref:immunity 53 family protein n=1 Tax=Myxococcus sp. CA056 TaxID=2741740 RepID=UPI001C2CEB46|nr:immunity 53 family protein [Myxococcus sp. CA056]